MENKINETVPIKPMDTLNRIVYGDMNPLGLDETGDLYDTFTKLINQENGNYVTQKIDQDASRFFCYEELLDITLINTKNEIKNKVYNCQDDFSKIKDIIRDYQLKFTNAINSIEKIYLSSEDADSVYKITDKKSSQDIFKTTHSTFGKLLCFLEKDYYPYLDHALPIPNQIVLWFIWDNFKMVASIMQKFRTEQLPYHLDEILNEPLDAFLYLHQKKCTYIEKEYYTKYIHELRNCIDNSDEQVHQFYILLIGMEVNIPLAFEFLRKFIIDAIDNLENQESKINALSSFLEELKTISRVTDIKFAPDRPLLREQLNEWLQYKIEETQKDKLV